MLYYIVSSIWININLNVMFVAVSLYDFLL